MHRSTRFAAHALAGAALLALAPRADADWGTVKPDLRVFAVAPSVIGPLYVRVALANSTSVAAGPHVVRVRIQSTAPVVKYFSVSGQPANSGVSYDFYVGYSVLAKPGLVTEAFADAYGQVPETNESNNRGYFVAPP